MPEQKTNKLSFNIGADPEFAIMAGNKYLDAKKVLQEIFKGENIEQKQEGFDIGEYGNIGWDGCSSTGEIRPMFSDNPKTLADNIEKLFSSISERSSIISVHSMSYMIPMGGHIHLDIPENVKLMSSSKKESWLNDAMRILATMWFPIMMSESRVNINSRIRNNYGRMLDARYQQKTLEFRCPTAEWLTTRSICEATLAYVATIWNEIIKNTDTIKNSRNKIITSSIQAESMQKMALADIEIVNDVIVKEIKTLIKKFELYKKFKNEIDYITDYKERFKEKSNLNYNILKGWKIVKSEKIPNIKEFIGTKKIKEISQKKDIEAMKSMSGILYNGDMMMDAFANELSKRIIAFDIHPKFQFILFGMRKGINNVIAFNNKKEIIDITKNAFETKKDVSSFQSNIMDKIITKYRIVKTHKNYEWKFCDKENNEKQIFLGIPYDQRTNNETKEMLETFYDINSGKFKEIKTQEIINSLPETIEIKVKEKCQGKEGEGEVIVENIIQSEGRIKKILENEQKEEIIRKMENVNLKTNGTDGLEQTSQLEHEIF